MWIDDGTGKLVRVTKNGKKLGWPKGKSRKPQVEALREIEKRIESADILSNEEKAEARARAREHVLKTRKEKAIDEYFQASVKAEETAISPSERLVDFTVDLPEFTYLIKIDGRDYYHGCHYRVPARQSDSMRDIQARAWEHDWEINGRRRRNDMVRDPFGRGMNQQRMTQMSMSTGQVTNTDTLRRI